MIKLVPAKCPQCGADIEVNKDIEKAICQYCGTTVLVDDAVQKYKVELSGKVKVDGVKNRDDFLDQAKKHHKVGEFDEAITALNNILKKDKFDVEAICELIRNQISVIKANDYNPCISCFKKGYDEELHNMVVEIGDNYDRMAKFDESKERDKYLKDIKADVDKYVEIGRDIKELDDKLPGLVKKINQLYAEACAKEWEKDFFNTIKEYFDVSGISSTKHMDKDAYAKDSYDFMKVDQIGVDGAFNIMYDKYTFEDGNNPSRVFLYSNSSNVCKEPKEMLERIKKFEDNYDTIKEQGVEKGKQNIKEAKKNKLKVVIICLAVLVGCIIGIILLGKNILSMELIEGEEESFYSGMIFKVIGIIVLLLFAGGSIKVLKDDFF